MIANLPYSLSLDVSNVNEYRMSFHTHVPGARLDWFGMESTREDTPDKGFRLVYNLL